VFVRMLDKKVLVLFSFALAACATEVTPGEVESSTENLAQTGPWRIPPAVATLGDEQDVTLTEAGPWVGPSGCSGGFTEGGDAFSTYLRANFPQITSIGGYSCREIVGIPGEMSVHGTGRALDVFFPLDSAVSGEGNADNDLGDPVANWLVANAEFIGIQRVIWDRLMWQADVPEGYSREVPYTWAGSHPHNDHIHLELTLEAAEMLTDFFTGPMDPPVPAECTRLPWGGGTIDNEDGCFQAFGQSRFWRVVEGDGVGDSYTWTNAFQGASPSNWARWIPLVSAPGDYSVEVNLVAAHAVYGSTRYAISHSGTTSNVTVDQSEADGWVSLGTFAFDGRAGEHVSVYDNAPSSVARDQHVCVDALRITNLAPPPADAGVAGPDSGTRPALDGGVPYADASTDPGADAFVPTEPTPPAPGSTDSGGCSLARSTSSDGSLGGAAWALVVGLALAFRRRSAA
jgi:hypothetical protein